MNTALLLQILLNLGNKLSNLFVFAFILSRTKAFRRIISMKQLQLKDKLLLSFIFGVFGIAGTYFSFEYNGALINTRIIGVASGGLLGGPLVGFLSGIIAGVHRGLINAGTTTSTACAISTVFEGIMAGYMGLLLSNTKKMWPLALITGAIAETMRKTMLLIMVKPFEVALDLVMDIWIPMVIINSIGLALFFMILENVIKDRERLAAKQAQLSLAIVEEALPLLRKGFNSQEMGKVAKIIYKHTGFDAVSFTDIEKILAHVGSRSSKHQVGAPLWVALEQETFQRVLPKLKPSKQETICKDGDECAFKSAIIQPLNDGEKIIGALALYKESEHALSEIDEQLGEGLAKLISTELRISKIEHLSRMVKEAEIKALQAQINPHFLFNSLTVIGSLCRIHPEKARELIFSLSRFFRKNLNTNKQLVSISEEIEHVKAYVEIEMTRLSDQLEVSYQIDPLLEFQIPPLTLQPLVENAIKHGIYPKRGKGLITFRLSVNNGYYQISIKDNGVGIEQNKLKQLLNMKQTESNSYGLSNVINRLIGYYGEEFTWTIQSEVNVGTEVRVLIPKVKVITHV